MFDLQKECGLRVIKDLVKGDKTLSRICKHSIAS